VAIIQSPPIHSVQLTSCEQKTETLAGYLCWFWWDTLLRHTNTCPACGVSNVLPWISGIQCCLWQNLVLSSWATDLT